MTFQKGDLARFTERFACYEAGGAVEVMDVERGERTDLIHFKGSWGRGNCYAYRLEKIQKVNETSN